MLFAVHLVPISMQFVSLSVCLTKVLRNFKAKKKPQNNNSIQYNVPNTHDMSISPFLKFFLSKSSAAITVVKQHGTSNQKQSAVLCVHIFGVYLKISMQFSIHKLVYLII